MMLTQLCRTKTDAKSCQGCTYPGGCCCAKRVPKTVTTSVGRSTVTRQTTSTVRRVVIRTTTSTVSLSTIPVSKARALLARRQDDGKEHVHVLAARHLCSAECPKGAKLTANTNNGAGTGVQYCCPARATVTKTKTVGATTKFKTVKVTRTVTSMKTAYKTVTPKQAIGGKLFLDRNKNGVYDKGIDVPYVNETIELRMAPTGKRAKLRLQLQDTTLNHEDGGALLGSATTNGTGDYQMGIYLDVPPNSTLHIASPETPEVQIVGLVSDINGTVDKIKNMPVVVPAPTILKTTLVEYDNFTITGTTAGGTWVYLFEYGDSLGSTGHPIWSGAYAISVRLKTDGVHHLAIQAINPATGNASIAIDLGDIEVAFPVPPPTVLNATVIDQSVLLKGNLSSRSTYKLYVLEGTKVVWSSSQQIFNRTFALLVPLAPGQHHLTIFAQDARFGRNSTIVDLGLFTIYPPVPVPTVSFVDPDGLSITIEGTTSVSCVVYLFADSNLVSGTNGAVLGNFKIAATLEKGDHQLSLVCHLTEDGRQSPFLDLGTFEFTGTAWPTMPPTLSGTLTPTVTLGGTTPTVTL